MLEIYCNTQASGCSAGFTMRLAVLAASVNGGAGPPFSGVEGVNESAVTLAGAAAANSAATRVRTNYDTGMAAERIAAREYPFAKRQQTRDTVFGDAGSTYWTARRPSR